MFEVGNGGTVVKSSFRETNGVVTTLFVRLFLFSMMWLFPEGQGWRRYGGLQVWRGLESEIHVF